MEAAALKFAGSAASFIITKLGDKASSYLGGDITEEDLQYLQTTILPKFQTIVAAEEQTDIATLKPWLKTIEAACYEAEDVYDMYEYKRLKSEVSQLPSSLKKFKKFAKDVVAPFTPKTKLKKSIEKLKKYVEDAKHYPSFHNMMTQSRSTQDMTSTQRIEAIRGCYPYTKVYGRDGDRFSLQNMLKSATNQPNNVTPVIAILGIGGAGKTTFAHWVYDDLTSEDYSNKMFVYESRQFNILEITQDILCQATGDNKDKKITDRNQLRTKLKTTLESKSFLLVIDNVWLEDKAIWDTLVGPLNNGHTGSRIIITARTDAVATSLGVKDNCRFWLPELNSVHIWSIFKQYAFGNAEKKIDERELLKIAEKIVKKLHNSPLATRMVGRMLIERSDISIWKATLMKAEMMKDTMDVLYLSFQELPSHLQQCFIFCSLFPKGYIFYEDDISNLQKFWIAQGYVEANTIEFTLEDKAMQYFNELVSYSFFQGDVAEGYHIHDLLHDLAENVSKGHCFRLERDEDVTIPESTMHLSINNNDICLHLTQILELANL